MKETVRLNPECIKCLVTRQLERCPEDVTDDKKIEYMQRVLELMSRVSKAESGPTIVREIDKIQKEMFGNEMDYSDIKKYFNGWMLEKEAEIRNRVEEQQDQVKAAVQYAMMGNYIDFGAMNRVDEDKLAAFLEGAKDIGIDAAEYTALLADLERAKSLVYITDNCGEIVMDKILIGILKEKYPRLSITIIVRGKPVLNDATMEDAAQIGLDREAMVIGNGTDVAGTCLEEVSEQAREAVDSADVILAKGQGNFETLQKCGKNIYYIFMCKCDMFAKRFNVPKYTGVLINDKNC